MEIIYKKLLLIRRKVCKLYENNEHNLFYILKLSKEINVVLKNVMKAIQLSAIFE